MFDEKSRYKGLTTYERTNRRGRTVATVPVPPEPPTPPPEAATRRVVQSHVGIHLSLGNFRWWVKNLFGLKPAYIYIVTILFLLAKSH